MTHVVTENCSACRYTDCVEVCPVDCFHASSDRLYIDPAACIDCGLCVPVCPVEAIFNALDLEQAQIHWIRANEVRAATLPVLRQKIGALPGADLRRAFLLGY